QVPARTDVTAAAVACDGELEVRCTCDSDSDRHFGATFACGERRLAHVRLREATAGQRDRVVLRWQQRHGCTRHDVYMLRAGIVHRSRTEPRLHVARGLEPYLAERGRERGMRAGAWQIGRALDRTRLARDRILERTRPPLERQVLDL